jgi:hypothetical protein
MEVSEIYVHDARLYRVIEDLEADLIVMQVDLPILELNEELQPRFLVFEDVYGHQAFEGPIVGTTVILDMHVVGRTGGWQQVRIETTAGYRDLFCVSVRVSEDNPIK